MGDLDELERLTREPTRSDDDGYTALAEPGLEAATIDARRKFVLRERSVLDDGHEDRLHRVWATNPGVLSRGAALHAADETVRAFATSLTGEWSMVDLRAATPGMGFSWGRGEYPTGLRRYGDERLFANAAPARRTGLLSRLFGR